MVITEGEYHDYHSGALYDLGEHSVAYAYPVPWHRAKRVPLRFETWIYLVDGVTEGPKCQGTCDETRKKLDQGVGDALAPREASVNAQRERYRGDHVRARDATADVDTEHPGKPPGPTYLKGAVD